MKILGRLKILILLQYLSVCDRMRLCIEMSSLLSRIRVIPIPALEDNYMYLVFDKDKKRGLAVDPVQPERIIKKSKEENVNIEAALITHHHWDHAGGNKELRQLLPSVHVIGGDDRIEEMNEHVKHEDNINVAGLQIRCLSTPCHTKGHVCYVITEGTDEVVFTGDTLFIGGCGKFFEGDGAGMHRNLNSILSALPHSTLVFPGHEYTTSNLTFAHYAEPENEKVKSKLEWSRECDLQNIPTVPSSIGEEKEINPFMRVHLSSIKKFVDGEDAVEVMSRLRDAKNNFKSKH